jgi:hypothetical protein
MTRRPANRHPRRLLRTRSTPSRPEHGLDLALPMLRDMPGPAPETAARGDQRAVRALAEENALLARELGRVQARCTQWRDSCIAQADRLEAQLMRARGENILKETRLAALRDTLDVLHQRAAVWLTNRELARRVSDLRARNRMLEAELAETGRAGPAVRGADEQRTAAPAVPSMAARRVLCVGGRARQIPVYRDLVERAGGRFAYIDGAASDCLPDLRRTLADADLVILQPGFVCRCACDAVEAHCTRLGVRCIRLDQTCALGFARGLARASDAG